jgi:hypothetical protein
VKRNGHASFFPNTSNMTKLMNKWANIVVIKDSLILDSMHNISNLRDTEVVVCIK